MATPEKKEAPKMVEPPLDLPACEKTTFPFPPQKYGSAVVVRVGSGAEIRSFTVYKGLLTHFSSYFRGALQNHWIEGATRTVTLADESPEVFSIFFDWLFTGKLYLELATDGSIPLACQSIIEVYVFADKRGVPELGNAALDLLAQKSMQAFRFPKFALHYVWDNTPEKSTLRKFLVDFATENYDWTGVENDRSVYPLDFLIDVLAAHRGNKEGLGLLCSGKLPWIEKKRQEMCSKYHDHPEHNDAPTSS